MLLRQAAASRKGDSRHLTQRRKETSCKALQLNGQRRRCKNRPQRRIRREIKCVCRKIALVAVELRHGSLETFLEVRKIKMGRASRSIDFVRASGYPRCASRAMRYTCRQVVLRLRSAASPNRLLDHRFSSIRACENLP